MKEILNRLKRIFRKPKPLTDDQRLAVMIAMSQRLSDRLNGKSVESVSEMLIRLGIKGSNAH